MMMHGKKDIRKEDEEGKKVGRRKKMRKEVAWDI